jgi:hypothetical protein
MIMVDDSGLALSFVEQGWRYTSLEENAFLYDERSEFLARVDVELARMLPTASGAGSLRAALAQLAQAGSLAIELDHEHDAQEIGTETVVSLTLLGVRVDVRCAKQACAERIAAFYSACVVPAMSASPEVVVWCDWDEAGRYLFRSRPDDLDGTPLEGVEAQTLRSPRQPWTSTLPPIPALGIWPFKDRFAALHAATVRTTAGEGIVIVGERSAGKSTSALVLAQRLGAEVLADETTFVHCRTTMVEPFPHAVGVWRDGRKAQVPITDVVERVGRYPVSVSRIVFLRRTEGGPVKVGPITHSAALRRLLSHHRAAGASIGDAMQTLLHLAGRAESWEIEYSAYEALGDLICEFVGG